MATILFLDYYFFGKVNEVVLAWSLKIIPVLVGIRPARKILEQINITLSGNNLERGFSDITYRETNLLNKLLFYADGTFSYTKMAALFGNVITMLLFIDYWMFGRVDIVIMEWSVNVIAVLLGLQPAQQGFESLQKLGENGLNKITRHVSRKKRKKEETKPSVIKESKIKEDNKQASTIKPTTDMELFVAKRYEDARKCEERTGIHRVFMLAMAACESNMGKSGIGNGRYNLWGIKAGKSWKGKKVLLRTKENHKDDQQGHRYPEVISITWDPKKKKHLYVVKDYFRSYDTFDQAIEDWSVNILQNRYHKHAWPYRGDPRKYIVELQSIPPHYATGANYVETILNQIEEVEKTIKKFKLK
jgi:flagellar protein FlgJ